MIITEEYLDKAFDKYNIKMFDKNCRDHALDWQNQKQNSVGCNAGKPGWENGGRKTTRFMFQHITTCRARSSTTS